MANWKTETTASTFDANAQINKQLEGRRREGGSGNGIPTGYATLTASDKDLKRAGGDSVWGSIFNEEQKFYGDYKTENRFGDIVGVTYDIVGIDGNQVTNMRNQIEAYVASIQSYLEKAIETTESELNSGFRGAQAVEAVKLYLDKVKVYINNVVSTLNAFSDKLADVGNAWVKAQSNIASNINASTGAFSEGTAYVADMQYNGPSS